MKMNITQEKLEILITKHLDGEITPEEKQTLQTALDADPKARQLFEQFQSLHTQTCRAVREQLIEQTAPAEEIFERACRHKDSVPFVRTFRAANWLRFAAGLAAGIITGLILHFAVLTPGAPSPEPGPREIALDDTPIQPVIEEPPMLLPAGLNDNVARKVDYYLFTDKDGTEWLIEGYRQNKALPAAYGGNL